MPGRVRAAWDAPNGLARCIHSPNGCFNGLAERRIEFDLVSDLGQHLDATQIEVVDDRAHIEVAQSKVCDDTKITDRLALFLFLVKGLLAEIVHDISGYRPVTRGRGVG